MDLPLTEGGTRNARSLGNALRGRSFAHVFTSPLQRARKTCELAGFGAQAEVDHDLVEWNYGEYEGLRTDEIEARRPGWELFRDGCPGGESPADLRARADRVVERVRAFQQDVLIFSSGHFLRVLAARWLGFVPQAGEHFLLSTASLSALSYEDDLPRPVIKFWNDLHHLMHHQERAARLPLRNSTINYKGKEVATIVRAARPDTKLMEQYGCGPIKFTGTDEALYERHLLFDSVTDITVSPT